MAAADSTKIKEAMVVAAAALAANFVADEAHQANFVAAAVAPANFAEDAVAAGAGRTEAADAVAASVVAEWEDAVVEAAGLKAAGDHRSTNLGVGEVSRQHLFHHPKFQRGAVMGETDLAKTRLNPPS